MSPQMAHRKHLEMTRLYQQVLFNIFSVAGIATSVKGEAYYERCEVQYTKIHQQHFAGSTRSR